MFSQPSAFSTSPTVASRKPSATSKRNVYDATRRRSDAEKSVLQKKKKVGAGVIKKSFSGPSLAVKAVKAAAAGNLQKSDCACKHDEETKAAPLAKSGKISDLPSASSSDHPDCAQCPHCSHMLHNKPKSTAKATRFWK